MIAAHNQLQVSLLELASSDLFPSATREKGVNANLLNIAYSTAKRKIMSYVYCAATLNLVCFKSPPTFSEDQIAQEKKAFWPRASNVL